MKKQYIIGGIVGAVVALGGEQLVKLVSKKYGDSFKKAYQNALDQARGVMNKSNNENNESAKEETDKK